MKTLKNTSQGYYEEKGSKFLGQAFPIESKNEVTNLLVDLKKQHPKAVHVCFAFRLGASEMEERSADDGEPTNSAGPPILNQIRHFELTNVLVAVVRYYGGVNLGVGGLMKAYKTASKESILKNVIIEKEELFDMHIEIENDCFSHFMKFVKQMGIKITRQDYTTKHVLKIQVDEFLKNKVIHQANQIPGINIL